MKMSFELEKILTLSAKDYCDMNGKKITDFEPKGIHIRITFAHIESKEPLLIFAERIPSATEIVVNYTATTNNSYYYASGVALIPKKNLMPDISNS